MVAQTVAVKTLYLTQLRAGQATDKLVRFVLSCCGFVIDGTVVVMTTTDDWDTVEDAKMVVTDIAVLSKKEKAPPDYAVVSLWRFRSFWLRYLGVCVQIENTHDGKKANFPEGRLGLTTRYICYTKKSASPTRVSSDRNQSFTLVFTKAVYGAHSDA